MCTRQLHERCVVKGDQILGQLVPENRGVFEGAKSFFEHSLMVLMRVQRTGHESEIGRKSPVLCDEQLEDLLSQFGEVTHGEPIHLTGRAWDAQGKGACSAFLLEDILGKTFRNRSFTAAQCEVSDFSSLLYQACNSASASEFVVGVRTDNEHAVKESVQIRVTHGVIRLSRGLAGFPTTVDPAGTSRMTTAPVPIVTSLPIVSLLLIALLGATQTLAPMAVLPPTMLLAMRSANSPISQLCAT